MKGRSRNTVKIKRMRREGRKDGVEIEGWQETEIWIVKKNRNNKKRGKKRKCENWKFGGEAECGNVRGKTCE